MTLRRDILALLALCTCASIADTNGVETLAERYWRLHRDRNSTVRYGAAPYCGTNAVDGSGIVSAAVDMAPEDIAAWLAPPPGAGEVCDGDLWIDCLAIPEGTWLCECPVVGSSAVEWRAAICQSNLLAAVVWRHAVGLAPTNLPVTIAHDATRTIGCIERLYYESGTGIVARIRVRSTGYEEAVAARYAKISPDLLCYTTVTNVAIRQDGWMHEHQDYIEERCVPRGEDMSSVTNVPAGVQAVVMAPVYLTGISLVRTPLLPTYIEQVVPVNVTNAYPTRPPALWHW